MDTPLRCLRPTRRGGVCQIPLRGGICPTHDLPPERLATRNSKVAHSAKANHPRKYRQQHKECGRAGYVAVGGEVWWQDQTEKARLYRLAHPSAPEQWTMDVLEVAGFTGYEREVKLLGDARAVDFYFPDLNLALEVWAHQDKPSFGERKARFEKQCDKLGDLARAEIKCYVVNLRREHVQEARLLVQFLREYAERSSGGLESTTTA